MMNFLDFLRRMFPAATPALKPIRKPRAKKPTTKKTSAATLKKKPAPKKK